MGKILNARGGVIDKNKRHQAVANEAMLNLVARVQNLEAVMIMLATLVQKDMTVAASAELDVVMEAYYKAAVQRGASHLSRELTDADPAIFI